MSAAVGQRQLMNAHSGCHWDAAVADNANDIFEKEDEHRK